MHRVFFLEKTILLNGHHALLTIFGYNQSAIPRAGPLWAAYPFKAGILEKSSKYFIWWLMIRNSTWKLWIQKAVRSVPVNKFNKQSYSDVTESGAVTTNAPLNREILPERNSWRLLVATGIP